MAENYKKTFIRKKRLYCSNCGKYGHKYIKCNEPITSIGIIAFKLKDDHDYDKVINIFNESNIYNIIKANTISYNLLLNVDEWKDKVEFLMIRRKKTLGYLEFMRGRYDVKDLLHLSHLIEQMTTEEINDIVEHDFDYLWKDLWKTNAENKFYKNEYDNSKIKFNKFKKNGLMLNIYQKVNLKYKTPEWGFPKGRRNYLEKNLDCATREFMEETGLDRDEFFLLENISPLSEIFHGTNDILYKHIYYIAICKSDINVSIDEKNLLQCEEIGDIGWFNYNKCSDLIRYYHNERQKVLNEIFLFSLNMSMNNFEKKKILIDEDIFNSSEYKDKDEMIYMNIDDIDIINNNLNEEI